jgi:hypothetical protein
MGLALNINNPLLRAGGLAEFARLERGLKGTTLPTDIYFEY